MQLGKKNKIFPHWEERCNANFILWDMIIFVQNPKKIWQIISKFNKVVEYKINIKKSIALLYTTPMAESEEELKEPLDEGEGGEWGSWLKT